ncbi:uncharacterized protein N7473_006379 [Penicillium subrubescens]|uniref:uncharacterized protein n=1 Tax=Penicillium subrubescens TaxID=1316194 RepID=UPI00254507B7|nr:uncharacterized protein N7473_006379 [Penicillium subrubescens]KAJ5896980.1 hypothetical protein N7473_006379 [Penicillium subrubescens]
MLKRVNSPFDATSPISKKQCKWKVIEAYKEISAAYAALERPLTAKSASLGSNEDGSASHLGVSHANKNGMESGILDGNVHKTARDNISSCDEGHNQDLAIGLGNGHDQGCERDNCRSRSKQEMEKI